MRKSRRFKAMLLLLLIGCFVASGRLRADSGMCAGQTITLPFTDVVGSMFFCDIAEIYFQGITVGTTATTYSPSSTVTRDQMAAFLGRTLDAGLRRGSARASLDQFWTTTPHYDLGLGAITLGSALRQMRSDGLHVWVADASGNVYRVRASDGKLLDTWTGAASASDVLCAMGRVFVTGNINPAGSLYMIDPTTSAGPVTTVASGLGSQPQGIGFDGNKIWTANSGSLSIVTPGTAIPWSVTNVSGFLHVTGIVYDGANIWVSDQGALKKLDANGNVLQTVILGGTPEAPAFDGKNIWVPIFPSTVVVVRASTGEILARLTGNGLNDGKTAAFDGERVLVTNFSNDSVSLWQATDFTSLGNFSTASGSDPWGACSDDQHFWIVLRGTNQLARF